MNIGERNSNKCFWFFFLLFLGAQTKLSVCPSQNGSVVQGKTRHLSFTSNTIKSVLLQPFKEISIPVQSTFFFRMFATLPVSFRAALPECKYNLRSVLYLIECIRWLKSCFKNSSTYCKYVKPFVHRHLNQMYFSLFFILSDCIPYRWGR